jgi:exosome complex component RRP42
MSEYQKRHLLKAISSGVRYDGRKNDDYRPVTIEYGVSETAEGSALVRIGETMVMAGVKLSLEAPYSDTPEDGNLMIGAEFLPIANPDFEAGPPSIDSIELARVTDRGIREGHAIDLKSLNYISGQKVWVVSVDICIMNDDGNLFDASSLATLAAIIDARYPEVKDNVVDYKHKTDKKLELQHMPLGVTVYKLGKNYLVDTTVFEQKQADSRLTVTVLEDGTLCALQKGGMGPLSKSDISIMIDLAMEKADYLRGLLNN